tara:strand:+ start:6823 stop:8295 length:1473 start_codon:yes stop_codon:yes gene_type:complete
MYLERINMLKEGRKETLIAKYPTSEELLTDYLTNSEIHRKTNYKYADWYLNQYFEIGSMEDIPEIEDGDIIITKFDKYRKNLDKKDINQYETIGELSDVISDYESERRGPISDSESVKIVNNDDVIIVKPLSHQSSCKYGAGTKWCTTHKDDKYFNEYDEKGNLYYIHLKTVESSNTFYKMAVFLSYDKQREEWYDSTDKRMGDGEVKLAKMLISKEYVELMFNDLISNIPVKSTSTEDLIQKIIDILEDRLDYSYELKDVQGYGYDDHNFWFECSSENDIYDDTIEERFMLGSGEEGFGETVISGVMKLVAHTQMNRVMIKFQFDEGSGLFKNTTLSSNSVNYAIRSDKFDFKNFHEVISQVTRRLFENPDALESMTNKVFWRSSNVMSTYKFNRKGPLTVSMVNYLDELDGELGSKIDFLLKSGKVKKSEDGYVAGDGSFVNIGGYFSTFFASLKDAGIIKYVRQGRRFMFTKGDNYIAFKEGKLKRI